MTSPIRALIFDFDGLIIDTESPEFETWLEIFGEFGASLKFEEWVACLGTSADAFDAAGILYQRTGYKTDNLTLWTEQKKRSIQKSNQLQPLPGIIHLLEEAKSAGLGLAVASSSPRTWVEGHLTRLNLFDSFNHVLTKDDVTFVKPEPDLYQKALNRLGVDPAQAIAFEDSPNGIKAARKAGLFCIAIPNPISRRLDLSEANLIINSLSETNLQELLSLVHIHNNGHCPSMMKA